MVISYDACRKWQRLNVTIHNTSVDNLFPHILNWLCWVVSELEAFWWRWPVLILQDCTDWVYLPHQTGRPEGKLSNIWKDGSLKPLAQHGLLISPWQPFSRNPITDSRFSLHLVEFCCWTVCNSLHYARLSPSWQPCMYMQWETKVTCKQMALGMEECAHAWQLTGSH